MEEKTVVVRRTPSDYRPATYKLSDINELHWNEVSGGIRTSFMGQFNIYCKVWCDKHISKDGVAHSGEFGLENHGACPHYIKVCILKKDNPEIYETLLQELPPNPNEPICRKSSITKNTCRADILHLLDEYKQMREVDIDAKMYELGHYGSNVNAILKRLAKRKKVICTRCPNDKRYNVYSIV